MNMKFLVVVTPTPDIYQYYITGSKIGHPCVGNIWIIKATYVHKYVHGGIHVILIKEE